MKMINEEYRFLSLMNTTSKPLMSRAKHLLNSVTKDAHFSTSCAEIPTQYARRDGYEWMDTNRLGRMVGWMVGIRLIGLFKFGDWIKNIHISRICSGNP